MGTEATSKQACPNHGSHSTSKQAVLRGEPHPDPDSSPARLSADGIVPPGPAQDLVSKQPSRSQSPEPPHAGAACSTSLSPPDLTHCLGMGTLHPVSFSGLRQEGISQASSGGAVRPSIYYFSADLCPTFGERALGACSSHCFCNLKDSGGGSRAWQNTRALHLHHV